MADLDDFFAKKDRKKSKGKKFATADEIAKKLEESGRRAEKLKKEKLQTSQLQNSEVDEQGNAVQDEDEWREFEEEKKDYTGLKIQNLTLAEYDSAEEGNSGAEGEEEGGMEENEAGEMVPKKKTTGPWKVPAAAAGTGTAGGGGGEEGGGGGEPESGGEGAPSSAPQPPSAEPSAAPPLPSAAGSAAAGSYVPPALRQAQKQQAPLFANARLQRKKAAPDVKSEELFPTLSAALTQEQPSSNPWSKRQNQTNVVGGGFEEVRNSRSHSARYEPPHMKDKSLSLGNKFGALNEQS